jgi:hypothetical protein
VSTQTEAPAFGTPGWTPEQLNEVRDQMAPPPVATGPAPADLNAKAATGIPTIADVEAMMATMQEQMEARLQAQAASFQAEIARVKAGQAPVGLHPLIGSAIALKDLVTQHLGTMVNSKPELMRLLDDVTDAATNAFDSGDVTAVVSLAEKAAKALARIHPGPGENPYYSQAVNFATVHIPDAAETITGPNPNRPAVASSQPPARVISGSVTG